MKEEKKKFNWKKAGIVAALAAVAAGSFLLGVLAGKEHPEKVLELENRSLRRELKKTQNRVESLSYRLGKVAQLLETYRKE